MKSYTFKKGPLLSTLFTTSETKILKVKLSLSSCFLAQIQGPCNTKLLDEITLWLEKYIDQKPLTTLALDLSKLTNFQNKVLLKLQETSLKEVISYKKLAEAVDSPKAYRAVGSFCKNNPFPLIIPCHRVICANGFIGQYNGGVEIKKRLLEFEKAVF